MRRRDFFKIMAGTTIWTLHTTNAQWAPILKPAADLAAPLETESLIFVYSSELSWQVVESARTYLQTVLGPLRQFELRPLSWAHGRKVRTEGFLTSASLNSSLSEDRLKVGSQFFEDGLAKMKWLNSTEGKQTQSRVFNWKQDHIHALAVGSPDVGFFSRQAWSSVDQLQGMIGGQWDVAGQWWQSLGTQIRSVRPETSLIHLIEGRVDFAGAMSHSNQLRILQRANRQNRLLGSLHYLTSSILSNPTIHLLTREDSQILSRSSQNKKDEASLAASRYLQATELQALQEIQKYLPTQKLEASIEIALHKIAQVQLKNHQMASSGELPFVNPYT